LTNVETIYLPQHECAHDKRTEDGDEAQHGRRIKTVDTCDVAGAEECRQQKKDLDSMVSTQTCAKLTLA